jgi:Family of unknown function (DUF6492)
MFHAQKATNKSNFMKTLDFAIITPSYAPDFKRCQLLSWSIKEFVSPSVNHYIIVDRRDLRLFSQLEGPNTKILTVESLLPWWIQRIPFSKNGWLSLKSLPIRNWIIQQIVKISAAQYIDTDVLIFVDSDTTFVRPFNLQSLIKDGKVRLFKEAPYDIETNLKGHKTANDILGIPNLNSPPSGYIGNIITWRRENVLKLYEKLESISGKSWIETLASSWHLSEYVLYGVFVDQFLNQESGHYHDAEKISYEYWLHETMSDEQLENFFAEIPSQHVAVMISSKAGISVERYQSLLKRVSKANTYV